MMILAFLTLLLITNGSAVGEMVENVTGIIGHNVLLSCGCSNDSGSLAWQKDLRVVNAYPQYSKTDIDQAYVNRTELFLEKDKSNCSMMIRKISPEDAGVYTCYVGVRVVDNLWSLTSLKVNLTVAEKDITQPQKIKEVPVDAVSISVPILVVLILGLAVLLTLLIKRRHWTNTDIDLPAQQPMIRSV